MFASVMAGLEAQEAATSKRKQDAFDSLTARHYIKKARTGNPRSKLLQRTKPTVKDGLTLDTLPGEIRNKIYNHLFQDSELEIFYRAPDPHGAIAGHTSHASPPRYLRPIAWFRDREQNDFVVLVNQRSGYGITLVNRLLRSETLSLFLERTTFICLDQNLTGLFCTHIPRAWKARIRFFSGSILGPYPPYHDVLPTDAEHFPGLRNMHLTVPIRPIDDWQIFASLPVLKSMDTNLLLAEFLSPSQKLRELPMADAAAAAYQRIMQRLPPSYTIQPLDDIEAVDAHMLISTRSDLCWTLSRGIRVHDKAPLFRSPVIPGRPTLAVHVDQVAQYTISWSNKDPKKVVRDFKCIEADGVLLRFPQRQEGLLEKWDIDGTWRARGKNLINVEEIMRWGRHTGNER